MNTTNKIFELENRVSTAKEKALHFFDGLKFESGYKYTVNHDILKYPAAILYGTWATGFAKSLLLGDAWKNDEEKGFIIKILEKYRQSDGTFIPNELLNTKHTKSVEYLKLHCTNYTIGAAISIRKDYDFQSYFLDAFLDPDYLKRWLQQRSFSRPWEESNNIVNVASYLALCNDHGDTRGKERLYQLLEWHNIHQNTQTGGFDNFRATRKNIRESMAGAVHNFHLHHYLGEPLNYEEKIANNVVSFLFEGPLTACLSIDFVELACRTISFLPNSYELEQALIYHLHCLLDYQNKDGGWYENETSRIPTSANGMQENKASSNSYATWFRLCSIGMIMITLFNDDPDKWKFRTSLGMGYAPNTWPNINLKSSKLDLNIFIKHKISSSPEIVKNKLIQLAARIIR